MGKEVRQSHEQLGLSHTVGTLLLLLAVVAIALLILPGTVGGSIVGDQPPASGDWVITRDTVVTDDTITISGNVSIQADLTLMGSTLRISPIYNGSESINVTALGALLANDSVIESGNDQSYSFLVHGEMNLTHVAVKDTFWGVQVRTGKDVLLNDVLLTDLYGSALQLEEADGTIVRDLRIHDNYYVLRTGQTISTDTVNGFVEIFDYLPGLIVISGGSPQIDGVDISVNGTLIYWVIFNQYTADGGIEMDLEWPIVDVDTQDAIAIKNILVRETALILACTVEHTQIIPQTTSTDINFGVSGIVFHNYREASVTGFSFRTVYRLQLFQNITSPQPIAHTSSMQDWGNRAVYAYVDEEFTSAGPHSFDLELRDIYLRDDTLLLHRMVPGYSGTSPPTFDLDLLVDNVTVYLSDEPVRLVLEPSFALFKTFDVDIRFNNCTFRQFMGPAVDFSYQSGPTTGSRSIVIKERTVFENCRFLEIDAGNQGIIKVSTDVLAPDAFNSGLTISDSSFLDNIGTLLNIYGSTSSPRDRLVLDGNIFSDNVCTGTQRLMYVAARSEIQMVNNSFIDNQGTNGILLEDLGAWLNIDTWSRDPTEFHIKNNIFLRNVVHEEHAPPKAFIDIVWGGDLNISGNHIEGTNSYFLNLSEFTDLSWYSTLVFSGNNVTENNHTVLYLTKNDLGHQYLEVFIRENVVWDNKGALVDFLLEPGLIQDNDFGAAFHLLGNDVSGARSNVFTAYGNITVSGNTFTDCVGWVLRLMHMNLHQPYLTDNTFTRCGDAILLEAKVTAPLPVLLWMDNNVIDSNGTAFYFFWMEVTMRNTNVSSTATRAVMAEVSNVDAYDCVLEMEDCEVVVDGYIRMWYWVDAWVHWASKSGVSTSNPVVDANVTFIDQADQPSLTVYANEIGQVETFEILAWHIEHSTAPVEKNPYTIMVSISSFSTTVEMNISHSYKGAAALDLLLWDPEDPFVSIDGPEHMSAHNTLELEINGFATDIGSGVHTLTINLFGGTPEIVLPDGTGSYEHVLQDVPEGLLEVRATVTDAGGNTMMVAINVEVDRTAPWLVVTHPSGDLHINASQINLRGEVEISTEFTINMIVYPTVTGAFDIDLPLVEGPNYFGLTTVDRAGNTASVVIWVTRDTLSPNLELFGPGDGTASNTSDIKVWGKASEYDVLTITLHRRFTDIIDRPIHPDENDQFEIWAELEEGENEIVVTALDKARNAVIIRRIVTLDTTPPLLELVSPYDNTLLNQYQVQVVLTVSNDAEQVYVNARRVLGTGGLETIVTLGEGDNPITIRAIDSLYNEAIISIIVRVDTVAPVLEITEPNRTTVRTNDPVIEVRGRVIDGDLNGITVLVAGQEATITTDGKFYHLLTLDDDGIHNVEVVAMDRAGNIARDTFTVDLRTEAPLMNLVFDPTDDRVDPGTLLKIQGAATGLPLTVTIVLVADGNRSEYTFWMENATFEHYLDLKKGKNTVTVRSVDSYGNWNVTAPHVVTAKEKTVQETSDASTLYLVVAIVVATALIGVAYVLVRRRP